MILVLAYHLAPSGSHVCDYGVSVLQNECESAALQLTPRTPGRQMVVGEYVGELEKGCRDGGWGQVPIGCSVQSGGDWTAHYKTSGDTGAGCIHEHYQLVCSGPGISINSKFDNL